jgi:hypothetical protein
MVPVYSISAILGIKFYSNDLYISGVHQFYESLLLASFFSLLWNYLHADISVLRGAFAMIKPKPWLHPVRAGIRCASGNFKHPGSNDDGLLWFNACHS